MSLQVVVGAGATGVATARLLAEAGDRVRLVTRRGGGPAHPGIERVAADARDAGALTALTAGATTLINCAAPAYHRWPTDFPPLAAALLAAAERTGAGYVMLGNLYGYGPVDGPLTEELPLAATTVKGRVRARIWQEALAAHRAGRVRVTEVRGSDFLGAGAVSIFTLLVARPVLAGRRAFMPADLDAAHSWTAVEDTARTLVAASRDDRSWGRPWHVPSPPPVPVRDLASRLARVAGVRAPRLHRLPTWALSAAGVVSPVARQIPEMLYLYRAPLIMDSAAAEGVFGIEPTPLDAILTATASSLT
jgi:nucleoside-diphosphate-sugar epimerase